MKQQRKSKAFITSAALKDLARKEAESPDGLHYRGITKRMLERSWSDLFTTKKERTAIAHFEMIKETCIALQKEKYTVIE